MKNVFKKQLEMLYIRPEFRHQRNKKIYLVTEFTLSAGDFLRCFWLLFVDILDVSQHSEIRSVLKLSRDLII